MRARRMRGLGRRAAVLAGLWCALAPAARVGATTGEARAVVEQTVAQVLEVLKNSALSSEQRRSGVEQIAYARFDFETMSRLVLARYWKSFSEPQREAFQREFKIFLAQSYGSRLDSYDQQKVDVLGERQEPRGDVTVRTRIVGGEFEGAAVDYRLRNKNGSWLVIDVVIEGISLVSNYRDQFREVLGRGGPEELLRQLRKKNAQPATQKS